MVIFHSYVKLPEGNNQVSCLGLKTQIISDPSPSSTRSTITWLSRMKPSVMSSIPIGFNLENIRGGSSSTSTLILISSWIPRDPRTPTETHRSTRGRTPVVLSTSTARTGDIPGSGYARQSWRLGHGWDNVGWFQKPSVGRVTQPIHVKETPTVESNCDLRKNLDNDTVINTHIYNIYKYIVNHNCTYIYIYICCLVWWLEVLELR